MSNQDEIEPALDHPEEKQVLYVRGMKVTFERDTEPVKLPRDLKKRLAHSMWHWFDDDWMESLEPSSEPRYLYGADDPDSKGALSHVPPVPEPERSKVIRAHIFETLQKIRNVLDRDDGEIPA
jgi:hypothetical protein